MEHKKWYIHVAAGSLVTLTLLGAAFAAGQQGTQTDPLVTLSYLTGKVTPQIMAQVDAKLTEREQALLAELNKTVDGYTKKMDEKLKNAGGADLTAGVFAVVDLAKGQTLLGSVGCELMLRTGTAVCTTPTTPGLIDMTDGSTLENGGGLVQNHLYMATVEGRGLEAKAPAKVLVRGSYTIT